MTDSDRAKAVSLRNDLKAMTVCQGGTEAAKGKLALLTKMLLTYPVANASAASGAARAEAYLDSLDDVPAGVLDLAIKRWNRGEAGADNDYRWAPSPAVLRRECLAVMEPMKSAFQDLTDLLTATTLDEAMQRDGYTPKVIESVHRLCCGLSRGKHDLSRGNPC